MKYLIFIILINIFNFNALATGFNELEKRLENIELIDKNLEKIIRTDFSYGAVKIKTKNALKKFGYNYGFFILKKNRKDDFYLNQEGYFTFVNIKKFIPDSPRAGRDVIKELGKMSLNSNFNTSILCKMNFSQKKKQSFNKYNKSIVKIYCDNDLEYMGEIAKGKPVHNIFGVMAHWSVNGYKLESSGEFKKSGNKIGSNFMIVLSDDVNKGVANVIPNYLKGYVINKKMTLSEKLLSIKKVKEVVIKEDLVSKKIAEQKIKELNEEKSRRIAEEKERKILEAKTKQLTEEKRLVELKAKKRTEEIAKEVAAEKQKKIEKERALRKAEELARKKAEKKVKERELKLEEERKKNSRNC